MKYQQKPLSFLFLVVTMLACNYSFQAGSFPPPHVQTIAVLPFDNETNRFELSGELYDQLVRNLPPALGIRTAGEEIADAVVRGSIRTYEVRAPNYRAATQGQPAEVLQRQVNIVVSVEIVDLVENVIFTSLGKSLWDTSAKAVIAAIMSIVSLQGLPIQI